MKTRNPFKRLARKIVVIWANYVFKKAKSSADARYAREHTMIYVASQPFRPDILTTYDRRRFKMEKEVWGFSARLLTLQTLKNGCYYHTPDTAGNQGMDEKEMERRRLFFIKERLAKARLL